jgi:hypothetical protein
MQRFAGYQRFFQFTWQRCQSFQPLFKSGNVRQVAEWLFPMDVENHENGGKSERERLSQNKI